MLCKKHGNLERTRYTISFGSYHIARVPKWIMMNAIHLIMDTTLTEVAFFMGLNPITNDSDESRAFQLCECQRCKIVQTCTPEHDFFCQQVNGPLFCEQCIITQNEQLYQEQEKSMTIERKVQQAGAVSLPRGYQQPGRNVTIEVKDENTLLLKFEPILNSSQKGTVDVYLLCVKEGTRETRVRAQFRAIDESGHVMTRWDASLAKYGYNNFFENYKKEDVEAAVRQYFPGKTLNLINAITDNTIVLPEIVAIKFAQVKERVNAEKSE